MTETEAYLNLQYALAELDISNNRPVDARIIQNVGSAMIEKALNG